jgi:cation-transporting ATPase E
LALICLVIGESFAFKPIHLTLISTLTIGTPSFFLALEPNYQRVSGKFLPTVLKTALPGGLADLLLVLTAQIVMGYIGFPQEQITTACVAILGAVGLSVLFRTCRPFNGFRQIIWWAMGIALVLAMTVLQGLFQLSYGSWDMLGVMAAFVAAAPLLYMLLCLAFKGKKK